MNSTRLSDFVHCVKCGTCRTVCPVFKTTGQEGHSARGKLSVLEFMYSQNQTFTSNTMELLNSCVVCGSCQDACPRGVEFTDIIEMARAKAVQEGKIPVLKKALLKAMSGNTLLKLSSSASKLIPESSGVTYKLPVIRKHFPLPSKSLDKILPLYSEPSVPLKFKILLFPGCSMRYFFSKTAEKMVAVLNRCGIGVYFNSELKCCGFPHLTAGEADMYETLKENNYEIFKSFENKTDYIVSGCATCGSALKNNYNIKNYKDINELIFEHLDRNILKKTGFNTLYHHPCHLKKHQNVTHQPEKILSECSHLHKLENADSCCGFGGSFSIFESSLSKSIGDRKSLDIETSLEKVPKNDRILVTSCPGCIIQLTDSVRRNNLDVKVKHIIDVIYNSLEEIDG